jgi:hypothetical protein
MSKWSHRCDKREGDMAHGITFLMWERQMKDCRGEAAFGKDKFHLDGKVSLTLALNQHAYGDELIAQVYGQSGVMKPRRASRYCRVQVYLGKADLETAETLEAIAKKIREKEENL